jgi:hypothetical protein
MAFFYNVYNRRGTLGLVLLLTAIVIVSSAVLLVLSPQASAHSQGKAIPKVEVASAPESPQAGLTHEITVTITDADSGKPVEGAEVELEATMSTPHFMQTLPQKVPPGPYPGTYVTKFRYPMAADWKLTVRVGGPQVREAVAEAEVAVRLTPPPENSPSGSRPQEGAGDAARAKVVVSGKLSSKDVLPLASLATHAAFAIIWLSAMLCIVAVVHPRTSGFFSEAFKETVLRKRSLYRVAAGVGGLGLVATGVLNGMVAAPFRLVPTISSIQQAAAYPFGTLYLLVLGGKIAALVALVAVNRIPAGASPERQLAMARFAIWADCVVIPLLLVLVTMLRYLHVLVHVSIAVG